jgi:hypothetical protein
MKYRRLLNVDWLLRGGIPYVVLTDRRVGLETVAECIFRGFLVS